MDAFDRIMAESLESSKQRESEGKSSSSEATARKVVSKKKAALDQPWETWQVSDQQEFSYEGKKYRAVPAEESNPNLKNSGYSRCKSCVFAQRKGDGGMSAHCWFVPSCEAQRRADKKFVIFEEIKSNGIDNNR